MSFVLGELRRHKDRLSDAAIVATKAATLGLAVDAWFNADSPRLRGKAIRTRSVGYSATLFLVPLAWRLLPKRGPYPRTLDLAIDLPLLLDAGGNAIGMYDRAHIDDVVHGMNAAILTGIAGSLIGPHVDERWQAAAAGAGAAVLGETLWETFEYLAYRMGQRGMALTYEDTMDDIIATWIGSVAGAMFVVARVAAKREVREQSGWRAPLGV